MQKLILKHSLAASLLRAGIAVVFGIILVLLPNLFEGLQVWSDTFMVQLKNKLEIFGKNPRDWSIAEAFMALYNNVVNPRFSESHFHF